MTTLDTAHKYPILIDGEPADLSDTLFEAVPSSGLQIVEDGGVVYAKPLAAGNVHLGAQQGSRGGSVDLVIEEDPLDISFGIGEAI